MAHTDPHARPAGAATEADGVNYRGLFWFAVILATTVVLSAALMSGVFKFLVSRGNREDAARASLAAPLANPHIENGNVIPSSPTAGPNLLTSEPENLAIFRAHEDELLTTYGWEDKNAGVVRIPIDRAKALLLERGIPGGSPMPAMSTNPATAPAATATVGKGSGGQDLTAAGKNTGKEGKGK